MFEAGDDVMYQGKRALVVERMQHDIYNIKKTHYTLYVIEQDGYRKQADESDLERVGSYWDRLQQVLNGPLPSSHPRQISIRHEADIDRMLIDIHLKYRQFDTVLGLSETMKERDINGSDKNR